MRGIDPDALSTVKPARIVEAGAVVAWVVKVVVAEYVAVGEVEAAVWGIVVGVAVLLCTPLDFIWAGVPPITTAAITAIITTAIIAGTRYFFGPFPCAGIAASGGYSTAGCTI